MTRGRIQRWKNERERETRDYECKEGEEDEGTEVEECRDGKEEKGIDSSVSAR